jgi:hypothetical protein
MPLNTEALAAEYIHIVGYNPFEDDATITAEAVAELADGVWSEMIDAAAESGDETEVERLMNEQAEYFNKRWVL